METMYRVDFIKVKDSSEEPVPGTGWSWSGAATGVADAVETATAAIVDALDDWGEYRIFRVVHMRLDSLLRG